MFLFIISYVKNLNMADARNPKLKFEDKLCVNKTKFIYIIALFPNLQYITIL
jgi:hypothetical protein